ncbi:MAG: hypothetical protein ACO1PI_10210 [Bacteroidota bacterium]
MRIPNGWVYRIVFAQWVIIAGIFKKKQSPTQTIYPEMESKQGDRGALAFALLVIILYIIYKRISGI